MVIALAASASYFMLFTRKQLADGTPPPSPSIGAEALPQEQTASETPVKPSPKTKTTATAETPPSPPTFGFSSPLDLGRDLAQSLARGDLTRAGQLAAAGTTESDATAEASAVFNKIIHDLGFKSGDPQEVAVIGQVEQFTRLSVPLKAADGTTLRLQVDVERDAKMGWKVHELRLPPELSGALAALPETAPATGANAAAPTSPTPSDSTPAASAAAAPASGTPPARGLFTVNSTPDALTFAGDFVQKLLGHNFGEARSFIDESRVPAERLAGLCIVFEEGEYALLPAKPLVITAVTGDVSWVIAQVLSDKLQQQTEFGIELQRNSQTESWRVVGLNLSDMLSAFARSATKLGIPYTPIVKNPKGGESLALYFEYDEAGLHPRAQRQLQIIADLLKSDSQRRLRIAGHTDALGAEDYNQRLSKERAESVKAELMALGVDGTQIQTQGLGTQQPLGPNQRSDGTDDPEGRSRNRRAEVFLDF